MSATVDMQVRPIRLTVSEDERGRYGGCFACGDANALGLGLEFAAHGEDRVVAVYRPRPEHQGWPTVLHGGIVATLLDEAAAYVAYARGLHAATARLSVRFSTPAPLDQPLHVEGRLARATKRLLEVESSVRSLSGASVAEAQVTLMVLTDHQKRAFGLLGPSHQEDLNQCP